jgi:hypothetical protein
MMWVVCWAIRKYELLLLLCMHCCARMCKYCMRIYEVIAPTKPLSPEQARIKSMQAQVKRSQTPVKQERLSQRQTKLNQQRLTVSA